MWAYKFCKDAVSTTEIKKLRSENGSMVMIQELAWIFWVKILESDFINNYYILAFYVAQSGRSLPTFRRNVLPTSVGSINKPIKHQAAEKHCCNSDPEVALVSVPLLFLRDDPTSSIVPNIRYTEEFFSFRQENVGRVHQTIHNRVPPNRFKFIF
jgi:hypothetical protein